MFDGKLKAVTFSYDDGVTQDIRFIEMLNRYGLKGTFNLNSGRLGQTRCIEREGKTVLHNKVLASEVERIYKGHEVAAHTLTHPMLPTLSDDEVTRQVECDRLALSELVGYEVVGMAYPCGGVNFDQRVADVIRRTTGIKYARTTVSSGNFDIQSDLYVFKPTCYHHVEFDKMFELAEQFINLKTDTPKVFYIWGHAYEFDIHDTWDKMERFCELISGHGDIFYGTNREVLL